MNTQTIDPRQPLTFTIKGQDYHIKTPTVGQMYAIEELKSSLTNGKYGAIMQNTTYWSEYSLDNIDMFSQLTALCPGLIKDLKVDSWKDLDPFDLEDLKEAYKTQFLPWLNAFLFALKAVQEKKKSDGQPTTEQ